MSRVYEIPGYSEHNSFVGAGERRNTHYLVRHSKSYTNAGNPATGATPFFCTTLDTDRATISDLNEDGIRLATANAEKFAAEIAALGYSPADVVIYSSPFKRASQTAEIFAARLGVSTMQFDPRLGERNCGELDGQAFTVPTVLSELIRPDQSNPFNKNRGAESPMELVARTTAFIQETDARHKGKLIVSFTHWSTFQELKNAAMGEVPGKEQQIGYAEYTRLNVSRDLAYKPVTVMMLGSTPGYVNDATVQTSESVQCAQTSLAKRSDGIDFTVHPGKVVYTRQYCPEGGESVAVIASHAEPAAVRQVAQYLREEQKQSSLSVATYNGGQDAKHRTRGYTTFVPGITLDALASAWHVNAETMKEGDLYATCGFYTRPGFNGVFIQSECNPDKPHHNSPEQVLAWEEMATRVAQKTARDLGVEINLEYHNVNFTYLYYKEVKAAPVNVMSRPSLFAHHKAVDRVPTINDLPAGYSFDI